jgi:hypothetical protein
LVRCDKRSPFSGEATAFLSQQTPPPFFSQQSEPNGEVGTVDPNLTVCGAAEEGPVETNQSETNQLPEQSDKSGETGPVETNQLAHAVDGEGEGERKREETEEMQLVGTVPPACGVDEERRERIRRRFSGFVADPSRRDKQSPFTGEGTAHDTRHEEAHTDTNQPVFFVDWEQWGGRRANPPSAMLGGEQEGNDSSIDDLIYTLGGGNRRETGVSLSPDAGEGDEGEGGGSFLPQIAITPMAGGRGSFAFDGAGGEGAGGSAAATPVAAAAAGGQAGARKTMRTSTTNKSRSQSVMRRQTAVANHDYKTLEDMLGMFMDA